MVTSMKQGSRFTHVYLENWRNFTSVDVELERRVFLVGPNASGKSNFLDVFRFLHDLVAVGGGFQEAVQARGGVSRIRCLAARKKPDVVVRFQIGNGSEVPEWEYELRFAQTVRQRAEIKSERVSKHGKVIVQRPERADERDPERLTQTYLEQVNSNQKFREVADFCESVRYLHIVPQLVREPDRSVGRTNDPFGGDFIEQIARKPEKTRAAWLRRIRDALRVAVPQLTNLELWRDVRGTPHLRGKYEHWRAQGAWQQEDQFSDGTLRLMGLLWVILKGGGPLLLEEPELSLHPEVVRYIPAMFARAQARTGRQVMTSTHSPELLRDEGIGMDEVLLLTPGPEGTAVLPANAYEDIKVLLEGNVTMAEAVMPRTRPTRPEQLALFGA
jgi:predicted ATPase